MVLADREVGELVAVVLVGFGWMEVGDVVAGGWWERKRY